MCKQVLNEDQLPIVLDLKTAQFNFGDTEMFRA